MDISLVSSGTSFEKNLNEKNMYIKKEPMYTTFEGEHNGNDLFNYLKCCEIINLELGDSSVFQSQVIKFITSWIGKIEHKLEQTKQDYVKQFKSKPIVCSVCGMCFKKNKYLTAHMANHRNDNTTMCSICSHKCSQHSQLQIHMKKVHSVSQRKFECLLCCKRFVQKSHLNTHMLIHTGVKNYACEYCGARFSLNGNLKLHIRVCKKRETNSIVLRNFGCEECGKFYSCQSALNHHKKIHYGEKEYACNSCDKKFYYKTILSRHCLIHHNSEENWKFKCEHCKKKFAYKDLLVKHHVVHTKERKYICPICGKRFLQPGHLHSHKQSMHMEKRHCCVDCGKTFAMAGNLKQHLKVHQKSKAKIN